LERFGAIENRGMGLIFSKALMCDKIITEFMRIRMNAQKFGNR
jgi:hypothetical protein